jgi:hypothetical protein
MPKLRTKKGRVVVPKFGEHETEFEIQVVETITQLLAQIKYGNHVRIARLTLSSLSCNIDWDSRK